MHKEYRMMCGKDVEMAKNTNNIYRIAREHLGWSREVAAEELGMSDDKLERIENDKQSPNPQDVKIMSNVYHAPELCNLYCHHQCEVGHQYVPEIPEKDLPDIVVKLLNSVYEVNDIKKVLLSITADGEISDDEIPTLVEIQYALERLSKATEALQLCIERKIDDGVISKDLYVKELKEIINATIIN